MVELSKKWRSRLCLERKGNLYCVLATPTQMSLLQQSGILIANDFGYSILRDVEYFNSGISKLDGGADLGNYLVRVAREKPVTQLGGSSSNVSESAVSPSAQTSPRAASPEKS